MNAGRLKILLFDQHVPAEYKMVMHYPHRGLLASREKVTLDHLAMCFERDEKLQVPVSRLKHFAATGDGLADRRSR